MPPFRILTDVTELEALVPAWRRLLGRAVHAEPVSTPLWLLSWWRQFGGSDGRALRAVAVEDGGELVGLVPFVLRSAAHRLAIPVRRVELLATGEDEAEEVGSEYVGGLAIDGRKHTVARVTADALVDGALGEWDELRLPAMSGDDPLVPRLAEALRHRGLPAVVTRSGEAHFVPLPSTWGAYLTELGASRRYIVTRALRELDKWAGKGGWEMRSAVTPADLEDGRRVLLDLHSERWNAAGRAGVFANARFKRFHDDVMPRLWAGEDGAKLELLWLVVRGEPIAVSYNIVFGNKVYFYQSGRRMDVPKSVRPGIAMHALSIQRSIEAGRREYDFLEGQSRYKRDLALGHRPLVTLRAVAPHLRARTVEAARLLAERAIAHIRVVRARGAAAPRVAAEERAHADVMSERVTP
jgi:CelD/BcsL family acetyltransferase involved in cellulose biosynthesis